MPKGKIHTYMTSLVKAVNIGAIWFTKREYVSVITTDVLQLWEDLDLVLLPAPLFSKGIPL